MGFVLLRKLDRLFGRVGPWLVLAWIGATAAAAGPLFATGTVTPRCSGRWWSAC